MKHQFVFTICLLVGLVLSQPGVGNFPKSAEHRPQLRDQETSHIPNTYNRVDDYGKQYDSFSDEDPIDMEIDFIELCTLVALGLIGFTLKVVALVAICQCIKRRNQRRMIQAQQQVFVPQQQFSQPSIQNLIAFHYAEAQRLKSLLPQVPQGHPVDMYCNPINESHEMS